MTKAQDHNLEKKIEELEAQVAELNNKYLRSLADYQNLEKQTQTWRDEFIKFANQGLIIKLLEIVDDLEKAQEHLQDEGLKIIIDKMKTIFKNNGLEEIEVAGQEFNPADMEAVQVEPGEEDHQVTRILQKGYKLNGKIIRPAKVVVSTTTPSNSEGSHSDS
ncbi:nucleotide exchange factor GrpE [Patescibacteria group bacterium]|nr:nucleotide exchange factor GrpE [Patescibacteria group bacterium]